MPKRARAVRVGIRGYGNAKAVACFLPGGRQDGPSGLGPLTRPRIYPACAFRVRAAFFAEADLCAGLRLRAAARACLKSASLDAAAPLSRLSAFSVACERFRDGLAPFSAFLRSCFAFFRVSSGTLPFSGTGNFTPARLAFERPTGNCLLWSNAPHAPACGSTRFPRGRTPPLGWKQISLPACHVAHARCFLFSA